MNRQTTAIDVLVVGAGIAGLCAANALRKSGFSPVILEQSLGVGGRMETSKLRGHAIDTGAQFLSSRYEIIPALVKEFGLADELSNIQGDACIRSERGWHRLNARLPLSLWLSGLLDFRSCLRFGWHLQRTSGIKHRSLSDYSRWADLDDERTHAWLERIAATRVSIRLLEPILQGFYFQSPEHTSRALAAALSAFSVRKSEAMAIRSGLGSLPERMAATLDVRLGAGVECIERTDTGFHVRTEDASYLARGVIVAIPAPAALPCMASLDLCAQARALLNTGYTSSVNVSIVVGSSFSLPPALAGAYGLLVSRNARTHIAAIGIEAAKNRAQPSDTQCLNLMFSHAAACHYMALDDAAVLEAALHEGERWLPGLRDAVVATHIRRWPWAEPRSDIGRSSLIAEYRQACATERPRLLLAGDYLSMPYTEGAAESGVWAAKQLSHVLDEAYTGLPN